MTEKGGAFIQAVNMLREFGRQNDLTIVGTIAFLETLENGTTDTSVQNIYIVGSKEKKNSTNL